MEFTKYNSIENHTNRKFLSHFELEVPPDEICHFKEKIHGANLQIFVDEHEVKIGRRSGWILTDDNFYQSDKVISEIESNLKLTYHLVKSKYPNCGSYISICGEIFGGEYPHAEVAKVSGCNKVQKGVWYCPDIRFYAFDIRLVCVEEKPYLPWSECEEILDQAGIFRAQSIVKMPCSEVVKQLRRSAQVVEAPVCFASTIPKRLGLPEIEENWAEGYVICPEKSHFTRNGTRLIIKYKNDKFSESNSKSSHKVRKEEPAEIQNAWNEVYEKFCGDQEISNRIESVVSHEGEELLNKKHRGRMIGLLSQDLIIDLNKDDDLLYNKLEKSDQKVINKKIARDCGMAIYAYLKDY